MSNEKKDVTLDHPRIWLQNAADGAASGEGRLWCEDNVWPVDENDGEPTEYVRADIVDGLVAALKEIKFMRPLGPTKNKMIEAMERISCDALARHDFSSRKQGG